jgi:hypothetical protein
MFRKGETVMDKKIIPITDVGGVVSEIAIWWLYTHGGTIRSLAKALDVTPATFYYWARQGQIPLKHVKRISEVTEGEFPKERLRPDLFA